MEKKSRVFGNNFCFYLFCILSVCLITSPSSWAGDAKPVRKPAVAGAFYPADPEELARAVDSYLAMATPAKIEGSLWALIVPHAGYVYSGPVASFAFESLRGKDFDTVILIGNSHADYFDGISVFPEGFFETPLGKVEVDSALAAKLIANNPKIKARPQSHDRDHILEVQLPFLQRTLKSFKIVPIVFGNDSAELPLILETALKGLITDKTLVIASSDMSHYPSAGNANVADHKTIEAILSGDADNLTATLSGLERERIPNAETFLCGVSAVKTVMLLAKELGNEKIVLLKYANSGDTAGEPSRVVGYSAIAFSRLNPSAPLKETNQKKSENDELNLEQQKELLKIARSTVESYVTKKEVPKITTKDPALQRPLGAFVTLKKHGELRGCIGRFEPREPLTQVIVQMSIAAATQDPRFPPVSPGELGSLEYEISVLSPLRKVASADEIIAGRHGVQIVNGYRSGVFLPQVATENFWDRDTFLSILCQQKAGLPADCWKDPATDLYVFTAQVFSENEK